MDNNIRLMDEYKYGTVHGGINIYYNIFYITITGIFLYMLVSNSNTTVAGIEDMKSGIIMAWIVSALFSIINDYNSIDIDYWNHGCKPIIGFGSILFNFLFCGLVLDIASHNLNVALGYLYAFIIISTLFIYVRHTVVRDIEKEYTNEEFTAIEYKDTDNTINAEVDEKHICLDCIFHVDEYPEDMWYNNHCKSKKMKVDYYEKNGREFIVYDWFCSDINTNGNCKYFKPKKFSWR